MTLVKFGVITAVVDKGVWACEDSALRNDLNLRTSQLGFFYAPDRDYYIAEQMVKQLGFGEITSEPHIAPDPPDRVY